MESSDWIKESKCSRKSLRKLPILTLWSQKDKEEGNRDYFKIRKEATRKKKNTETTYLHLKMNLKVRNLLSSLLFTVQESNILRSKYTIMPESSAKTGWDCLGFIFIVWQSIMIHYNLCFSVHPEGGMVVFDTIIDCFFMADICKHNKNLICIVVNFSTGFYRKGLVIMNR